MGYEHILVADELDRSAQRAGGLPLQLRETLNELVRIMAAQQGACWPEDRISQDPTRHEVRVESEGRGHRAG